FSATEAELQVALRRGAALGHSVDLVRRAVGVRVARDALDADVAERGADRGGDPHGHAAGHVPAAGPGVRALDRAHRAAEVRLVVAVAGAATVGARDAAERRALGALLCAAGGQRVRGTDAVGLTDVAEEGTRDALAAAGVGRAAPRLGLAELERAAA